MQCFDPLRIIVADQNGNVGIRLGPLKFLLQFGIVKGIDFHGTESAGFRIGK